jgi:hypothetical protein
MKLQNLIHTLIGIVCIGLLPGAQAVVPPPHPGGNTAEGQNRVPSASPFAVGAATHETRAADSQAPTSPEAINLFGHPAFFTGEIPLVGGWYYLQFPNGTPLGYYIYLSDPHYIYHIDLGYEYLIDANDAFHGIYIYDFASGAFCYTSPSAFPYLYDFSLNAVLYYLQGTHNPRWFFNLATGQWFPS